MKALICLFIFFFSFANLYAQDRKAHSHVFNNFDAFSGNTGGIDEYGNAYLILYHNFDLPFINDTIEASNPGTSVSVCKVKPNGELIWYSQAKGLPGNIDLLIDETNVYCHGTFSDTITWEGQSLIEANPNASPFSSDAFVLKFDVDGNLEYLRGFPDDLEFISNVNVKNNSLYYTGRFVNQIILGTDTLTEDSTSNQNGEWDEFLGKLDENGQPVFSTYLGSPSMQVIPDLVLNDTSILFYGYFLSRPSIAPNITAPAFIFFEFDTIGNLVNLRPANLTAALPLMAIGLNSGMEFVTRDFSDSAENQLPANIIYGGQQHVGFYKYSLGAFSPPTYGIAFGGSIVELPNPADDKFSYSGDLISNFLSHPSGITYDGINQVNSPYSIMAFNSDKMEVEYFETSSGELKDVAISNGFQLLTASLLLDSVLEIDTLQIVNTPFVPEFLLYYTGDCEFFEPERIIQQVGDSLFIEKGELEIEWIKDNGVRVPNSLNRSSIRLIGEGTYYVELRNYFGCVHTSDTVTVISSLDNQQLFNAVSVYPNPTEGLINVRVSHDTIIAGLTLTVVNLDGKTIDQHIIDSPTQQVDISKLPSGLYFYEIKSHNYEYRGKVMKL